MDDTLPVEVVGKYMTAAPVDIDGLARELGIDVSRTVLPDDISGKIERKNDGNCAITINARHAMTRQRFTLAHEIAHYVLHRNLIGDGITDNGIYRSGRPEPIERQASQYAAEILMPWRLVLEKYRSGLKNPADLAGAFGVSAAVAEMRLKELQSFF